MATIRLVPSTYSLSSTSYLSVSDESNMYNNTDNETYATVTNSRTSTTSYYIYIKGFNFDDVPSEAVINSFTIKLKVRESGITTSTSYMMYLTNGTSALSDYASTMPSTSVSTITFDNVSSTWSTLSGYGSNLGIRVNCRRASRSTTGYLYVYGAEILVDYTMPIARTITTSGIGCTVTPEGATTAYEGNSFRLDITSTTPSLTVVDNGTDVTSQLKETPATAEVTAVPASYSTSGSISGTYYQNAVGQGADGSSTTGNNYCSSGSGSTAYIDYSFDVSAVPTGATISSVTCSVNGHCESTSSSSEVATVQLYSGSTAKGDSASFESTSDSVVEIGSGSAWTRDELDDLVLRFTIGYYGGNVSGATLTVAYEIESSGYNYYYLISNVAEDHTIVVTAGSVTTYTVTTSITNGSLISPTVASKEVVENSSYEIKFQGDEGATFQSMTVNGSSVTPTENTIAATTPTFTVSTNYSTYSGSLDNITDGDSSTYWWSSGAQSTGYYILLTFSAPINLNSFSTYSSNSTDYVHSNNELQVSADNSTWTSVGTFSDTSTSSFSEIGAKSIQYVRIYATSDISNWLYLNTITVGYESAEAAGTYYSYTISAVTGNTSVEVVFGTISNAWYIKLSGTWTKIGKVYQKANGQWVEITYGYDSTKKLIYKGGA